MREQHVLTAEMANSILGGTNVTRMSGLMILSLRPRKATSGVLCPLLASQVQADMDLQEKSSVNDHDND